MRKNKEERNFPNLPLLGGYLFILLMMVSFSFLQFSSTRNLMAIGIELQDQILDLSDPDTDDFEAAAARTRKFLKKEIFSILNSKLINDGESFAAESIHSPDDLRSTLKEAGILLDSYNRDLFRSQAILFISFIVFSVILSILLTISEFDQMKKYEREKNRRITDRKLLDLLEEERNLVAIELHDDVAQKLSIISQHFDHSEMEQHTELLKRYNSDVIYKIRAMAQSLRSPEFEYWEFQKQIEFLFADFRSISDIKLDASFNGLTAFKMEDKEKLHIYRIIQELLSNCRKHSSAFEAFISILYVHPILKIHYRDDGVGMDIDKEHRGLGLKSIKYRLRILNAEMKSTYDNGLKIQINIPVGI